MVERTGSPFQTPNIRTFPSKSSAFHPVSPGSTASTPDSQAINTEKGNDLFAEMPHFALPPPAHSNREVHQVKNDTQLADLSQVVVSAVIVAFVGYCLFYRL